MSAKQITIATIATRYATYLTKKGLLTTAQGVVTALGARPTYPDSITANADYNDVSDDIDEYNEAMVTARAGVVAAQAERDAAYQSLVEVMPSSPGIGVKIGSSPETWIEIPTLNAEPVETRTDPNP